MDDLELVKKELHEGTSSLILVRDGRILSRKNGSGIAPLLQLVTEERELLKGAVLGDKVIGRAAALLTVDKELSLLYTPLISEEAINILKGRVLYSYLKEVPFILRRDGKGQCPVESRVKDLVNPDIAEKVIREFVESISKSV